MARKCKYFWKLSGSFYKNFSFIDLPKSLLLGFFKFSLYLFHFHARPPIGLNENLANKKKLTPRKPPYLQLLKRQETLVLILILAWFKSSTIHQTYTNWYNGLGIWNKLITWYVYTRCRPMCEFNQCQNKWGVACVVLLLVRSMVVVCSFCCLLLLFNFRY